MGSPKCIARDDGHGTDLADDADAGCWWDAPELAGAVSVHRPNSQPSGAGAVPQCHMPVSQSCVHSPGRTMRSMRHACGHQAADRTPFGAGPSLQDDLPSERAIGSASSPRSQVDERASLSATGLSASTPQREHLSTDALSSDVDDGIDNLARYTPCGTPSSAGETLGRRAAGRNWRGLDGDRRWYRLGESKYASRLDAAKELAANLGLKTATPRLRDSREEEEEFVDKQCFSPSALRVVHEGGPGRAAELGCHPGMSSQYSRAGTRWDSCRGARRDLGRDSSGDSVSWRGGLRTISHPASRTVSRPSSSYSTSNRKIGRPTSQHIVANSQGRSRRFNFRTREVLSEISCEAMWEEPDIAILRPPDSPPTFRSCSAARARDRLPEELSFSPPNAPNGVLSEPGSSRSAGLSLAMPQQKRY